MLRAKLRLHVCGQRLAILFMAITVLLAITNLSGCGGGGSSSSGSVSVNGSVSDTGSVALVVGDESIHDFDEALFDISSVTLIGDDGQVLLLEGNRTIDFLKLETVNEILAETTVPAGKYHKVRLNVDNITLVKYGDPDELTDVEVLANGKVDVLVRGGFEVSPGGSIVLVMDFDLEKSIKLVTTPGRSGYHFRPVIFARVLEAFLSGRLVRVAGEYEAIEGYDSAFRICDADLMSDQDSVAEFFGCREIVTDGSTSIFTLINDSLSPATLDDLTNGEMVVTYGKLLRPGEMSESLPPQEETDEPQHFPLKAIVVAAGDYEIVEGRIDSEFSQADEEFELIDANSPSLSPDSVVRVDLPITEGAVIYNVNGEKLESTAIVPGRLAELEGVVTVSDPNTMEAFITILQPDLASIFLQGSITAIDLSNKILTVRDDTMTDHCVTITDQTTIQKITDMGETSETGAITLSELIEGSVEIRGEADSNSDCVIAASVVFLANES